MGVANETIDAVKKVGPFWIAPVLVMSVHVLIGALAVFGLWPGMFERFDVTKIVFTAAISTLTFDALGAGLICLGAWELKPRKAQVRYAFIFASCCVAVCQMAALWQMFITHVIEPRSMYFWGIVGALLCAFPAWAKRKEIEEDERDIREGNIGQRSFFRGRRKGGN